jgi:dTDP-4-dehydrorhamnose reductase
MTQIVKSNKVILVTGKNSRFCKYLINHLKQYKTIFTTKKQFNILNQKQMRNFLNKKKIDYIIHLAGLSRPMSVHDTNINKSIDLNIIGTSNVVKLCKSKNIKLIYFSTNYVYPGVKGNYSERDHLLPVNNYAWSKLGGESAVQMYTNSLILRICMTDYPFVHKKAVGGANSSFIFNKDVAKIIPYLLNERGVINIGGKKQEIYKFALKYKKKLLKINYKKIKNFPKDSSVNTEKLKKILKINKLINSDF